MLCLCAQQPPSPTATTPQASLPASPGTAAAPAQAASAPVTPPTASTTPVPAVPAPKQAPIIAAVPAVPAPVVPTPPTPAATPSAPSAPPPQLSVAATPAPAAPTIAPAEVATITTLKTALEAYNKNAEPIITKVDAVLLNNGATLADIAAAATELNKFVSADTSSAGNEKTFESLSGPGKASIQELMDKARAKQKRLKTLSANIVKRKIREKNNAHIADYRKQANELIAKATGLSEGSGVETIEDVINAIDNLQRDFDAKITALKKTAPDTEDLAKVDLATAELKTEEERLVGLKTVKK